MIELNRIYNLDCKQGLAMLPDNSVDMFITSPPYWAKRDYQTQPLVWGGDKNCEHEWSALCEPPSDKSDGFLHQRLPSGVSTGVNSDSSYRTVSRSHLGSALHDSKQRTNCISRPSTPEGQQLNLSLELKYDIPFHRYAMQGGTIHPPDKSGGLLYPPAPCYNPPRGGKNPAGSAANVRSNIYTNEMDLRGVGTYSNTCSKCGAWYGNLGMEQTPKLYVEHLLQIFDDVRRILTPFGSVYVNIGDTYSTHTSGSKKYTHNFRQANDANDNGIETLNKPNLDIGEKSLCCIPDMFKIGMVKRGWTCRSEIIWQKPNSMPSSASDRFSDDFEKLYFFVKSTDTLFWTNEKTLQLVQKQPKGKAEGVDWEWRPCPQCQREIPENGANIGDNNKEPYKKNNPHIMRLGSKVKAMKLVEEKPKERETCTRCGGTGQIKVSLWSSHDYYFEQQFEPYAVLNETSPSYRENGKSDSRQKNGEDVGARPAFGKSGFWRPSGMGRNKRSVWFPKGALWSINTKGFKDAHFAVFNEELIETPILASCPEFVCTVCGMPKVKIIKPTGDFIGYNGYGSKTAEEIDASPTSSLLTKQWKEKEIIGYAQCSCNAGFRRGILCDPFMGSGTTAVKARKMNRDFIGFELNPGYVVMAEKRLAQKVLIDFFDTNQEEV